MESQEEDVSEITSTRIAVYDDFLSAPRIIDIEPSDVARYIEEISSKTYELAQQKGSSIPYTVIREVCENFIHAQFKNPCISILEDGDTIKFTDQGPGITDKQRAQHPGFTSATSEMRKYIRGVGSGLPIVKDYLRFSNGRLIIEDNIKEGTVVTIQIEKNTSQTTPVIYREMPQKEKNAGDDISEREYNILVLAREMGLIGPTEVEQNLDISLSTGHRSLNKLENMGLLKKTEGGKKRMLTEKGLSFLDR